MLVGMQLDIESCVTMFERQLCIVTAVVVGVVDVSSPTLADDGLATNIGKNVTNFRTVMVVIAPTKSVTIAELPSLQKSKSLTVSPPR